MLKYRVMRFKLYVCEPFYPICSLFTTKHKLANFSAVANMLGKAGKANVFSAAC